MSSLGRISYSTSAVSLLIGLGMVAAANSAVAAVTVAPGYSLSVFAGPLAGSSAPDSIATVGADVFVGYGNGGNPDGSGGATSTIAEYTNKGAFVGSITVTGHNDGLRYDAATGQLWAIQNEDGNPNLVLINAKTLSPSAPLSFSSTPHGGGYDDVAFGQNGTYISASNPQSNPNTAPAIVSATVAGGTVNVAGVLSGAATATVINGGGTTTLNLQDPDSMVFSRTGALVLDSQADKQLVFVNGIGTVSQAVSVLNLPSTVDDTIFGGAGQQRLLFTDRGSGLVYALTGAFSFNQAISAADTLNEIVLVNPTTGAFTPLVTGLNGPHGEVLTDVVSSSVPEPAAWSTMLGGLFGAGALLRRRLVASART
ncbi:MAG: hypothetical protein JWO83_3706 [Caulobacteraceae bacterium]|nr:hypothetical protein [Caulobacteraceae bacterium]